MRTVRTRLSVLFVADGCVYRLAAWRMRSAVHYLDAARLLIDLRPRSFEMIAPPAAAMCW